MSISQNSKKSTNLLSVNTDDHQVYNYIIILYIFDYIKTRITHIRYKISIQS